MKYIVKNAKVPAHFPPPWNDPAWNNSDTLEIANFRPESSEHHPRTFARLMRSESGLVGAFRVEDRYVRCVRTNYLDEVWKDSCVEFFVKPNSGAGYFNFEFNCGGAFLVCFIRDHTRVPGGFKDFARIPLELARGVVVQSSLPPRVEPEITDPIDWTLSFFIPHSLLKHYVGPFDIQKGDEWRGNFFKCAEENSHPHWASWSPVTEFNFHLPECFGELQFA